MPTISVMTTIISPKASGISNRVRTMLLTTRRHCVAPYEMMVQSCSPQRAASPGRQTRCVGFASSLDGDFNGHRCCV